MKVIDGGSAFPVPSPVFDHIAGGEQLGMSLRDYFAAKAMVGIISHPTNQGTPAAVADISYQIADAMLVVRK